jgi:putative methyltransferase (TIGR04325 family)
VIGIFVEAQRLLPPLMIDFLLKCSRRRNGFTGNYETWDKAAAACDGYENQIIVSSYIQSFINEVQIKPSDLLPVTITDRQVRYLNAIQYAAKHRSPLKGNLQILDFGGAYGNHFPVIKQFLGKDLSRYVICESAAVSEAFNDFNTNELMWTDDLTQFAADSFDVVFSSCALPYVSEPEKYLKDLTRLGKWIVLDRLPILDEENSIIFKQNVRTMGGKSISYPAWYFSETKLKNEFRELNLNVEFEWSVPEDRPFVNGKRNSYRGYLLKRG